jgi:RNA polymerase sigma-70 factor (ECF subfamily)
MSDQAIQLIQEYQPLIKKVSMLYAQNQAEAEDMFQEICIQAWKAFPQFKGESKFSTWLYRVAINTAISWIRKEKKYKLGTSTDDEKWYGIRDDSPFYIEEEKKEQIAALHRAIKKLSDIDRSLVMLYLDDVAYNEISEILGLTVINIKVKMNRVKKRLKILMENDG